MKHLFHCSKRQILALLIAFIIGTGTVFAAGDFSAVCSTGQTLYYNIINPTQRYVEITYPGPSDDAAWDGFTRPTGAITLPSTVAYNGVTYTVKAIGRYAFYDCENLTGSLVIPNTVASIGDRAFFMCKNFDGTLTIPNSVTAIGEAAFGWCERLTGTLTIPNSVTSISTSAFYWCPLLTGLTIGSAVTSIGDFAFSMCVSMTGKLTIPNSVTSIGESAFNNCHSFTSLSLGSSLTSIGDYAFYSCYGFTGKLTIPNSVTTIGNEAFYGCTGFNGTLTLGNSVTTIGELAFYYCNGFNGSLTIPNSVTSIGYQAFYFCSGFTGNLTIGSSLTSMGSLIFMGCSGFTHLNYNAVNCGDLGSASRVFEDFTGTVTIGDAVQRIPAYLLYNCSGFTGTLTIPASVTSIGKEAFKNCTGFTQVNYNAVNCANVTANDAPFYGCGGVLVIGSSVQQIPNYLFFGCNGFTGLLTIPNSVISIGASAFYNCSGFTGSLTISNSVTSIGDYAFYGCNGLEQLTIGDAVTIIGSYAFYNCQGFTGSLIIPNSVTTIGQSAFWSCSGFTGSLTIGNSVTTIGENAFSNCRGISSIRAYPATPPPVTTTVFASIPKTIPVYVPCSSLEDYQAATGWKSFTNMQSFSSQVSLSVIPEDGGTVTGAGNYTECETCTVTATTYNEWPYYQFLHWSKDGEVVSCDPTYTFTVHEDVHLEAVFMRKQGVGTFVGEGVEDNAYLPSYSFYNYSLTQQIYTADELGSSQTINSISFFNTGNEKTRNYDIYLVHTNKTTFSSYTDWITVTSADKVFSGEVTMRKGLWTTIVLDKSFDYSGSSNLAIIVDDNTGEYTGLHHMRCRVYDAEGFQTLRIYNDDTNFDPYSPSSYGGSRMSVKNQIVLGRQVFNIAATASDASMGTVSGAGQYGCYDVCHLKATPNPGYIFIDWTDNTGKVVSVDEIYSFVVDNNKTLTANFAPDGDYCSLVFDLHDSWGDGWGNNYLKLDLENGMTRKLAVPSNGHDVTYTLPIENGSHVKLSWNKAVYYYECSFEVRYSNGNLVCTSDVYDLNTYFEYEFYMDCDEMSPLMVYVGDHGENTDQYLPSYTYYCYNLSEQIYTADEIGTAGNIGSIAFYNQGTTSVTRNYDIFLKATTKTAFDSSTDFISVTEEDKVFSGNVTFTPEAWVTITFDTPFAYDGSSNVVLVMDDNSNDYTTGGNHVFCRVFDAAGYQTLRLCNDYTNFDPYNPSYDGGWVNVKNQVYFGFMRTREQTIALAAGANYVSFNVETSLTDLQTALTDALGTTGVTMSIKSQTEYTELKRGKWTTGFNNFNVSEMFIIKVSSPCEITLTGAPIDAAAQTITIVPGANWIAYPLSQPMTITNVFTGFVGANDALTSQTQFSKYIRGKWSTEIELQPGQGYIYGSAATGDRPFVFPSGE